MAALFRQLGYPDAGAGLADRLSALLEDPRADVLVAAAKGALVGAVTMFFLPVAHEDGPWCRISALVVDEEHRVRGVGESLLAAAESAARAAGCSRIEATSALHREGAHRFYAARGYASSSQHFLKRF